MRNSILSAIGCVQITYSREPMAGNSLLWGLIPLLLFISGKDLHQILLLFLRTGSDQGRMRSQISDQGCLVLHHLLKPAFWDTYVFNQGMSLF
jgi:hypothetical protein